MTVFYRGVLPSARFPGSRPQAEYHVYWARTTADQDDVECNEGAAMTFVPGEHVAALEFGAAYLLKVFTTRVRPGRHSRRAA